MLFFPGSQDCLTAGSKALWQRPLCAAVECLHLALAFQKLFSLLFEGPQRVLVSIAHSQSFLTEGKKKNKGKRGKKRWFPSIEITLLEKLLKSSVHWSVFFCLFYKWRQRSSGVVRWGDFRQTENQSESPSDVIKFLYELLNSTTTPCGLASVRFERFLTSKFKKKNHSSTTTEISSCNMWKSLSLHHFSSLNSFHNKDPFSIHCRNQNLWVFHCCNGSLCPLKAGFTPHYFNLLKV